MPSASLHSTSSKSWDELFLLKVTKSRKQIKASPILPKNERNTIRIMFIYSEKATNFVKSYLILSYVVPVKSKVKILKNLWPSQNIWTLLSCMICFWYLLTCSVTQQNAHFWRHRVLLSEWWKLMKTNHVFTKQFLPLL